MPHIKWKPRWKLTVTSLCFLQLMACAEAQQMQEPISSMTADGWRPIVGTRKDYSSYHNNQEKKLKSTTITTQGPLSSTEPLTSKISVMPGPQMSNAYQRKPIMKINPFHGLPSRNGLVTLNAVTHGRPGYSGQIKHNAQKPTLQMTLGGKRYLKPMRIHGGINSGVNYNNNRDEVFLAAASGVPYIPFKHQVPVSNVKTRETLGLGLPSNHFSISQPSHSHIEFGNRFPEFDYRNTIPQNYPKQSNFHNELFRVNLVPPPPLYKPEGLKKVEQYRPELLKTEPVQVQVTKEKINAFHNQIPPNYSGDYVDYEYHGVKRVPTENAKPFTYEVTEKWPETPAYTLRPKPEVELKVPTFLPTPYKPEPLAPTSATQDEVSTIFTELSKLQRTKVHKVNPYEFEVREVSTHYPILGKPEFSDEAAPVNEITAREEKTEQVPETTTLTTTTSTTTTTAPPPITRNKIHRRRRPLRYRTSTTTEEPVAPEEEYYDIKKTEEADASYEVPARTRVSTESTRMRSRYRQHVSEQENEIPRRKPVLELYTEKPTTEEVVPSTSYEIVEIPTTTTETPQTTTVFETTTPEEELETTVRIDKITTTPKSRIRRPIKYDTTRPRFSVKDYRTKISTTTTSTEPTRGRNRQRRPSTSSTTEEPVEEEQTRSRFRPKDPRHNTSSIITENTVKAVNTRLRPFGRHRTTSTTTPATKVSIKPNLFARKRPPVLSLKARIAQKLNKTMEVVEEKEKVVTERILESEEDLEDKEESVKSEVTEQNEELEETTTPMMDILKTDDYSQRVSELTSSFKNEYETPGLFKSVAPGSRKIPNHFTISTDDPILPIEAFFPSIKERSRDVSGGDDE